MVSENMDTIYFSDDWLLPKYYGWVALVREENAVVFFKRVLFISKIIVLSCDLGAQEVNVILDKLSYNRFLTRIYWHNFTNVDSEESPMSPQATTDAAQIRLGSRWYEKASDSNKLIHWATYIINLEKEIDQILSEMESTVRNKFRRAQKKGAIVTFETEIGKWTEDFYKLFERLQEEFGLSVPDHNMLHEIFAGKNAVAVVGHDASGVSAINIIYLAKPYAYYMLGASSHSKEQGVGQLMQLETINYLKSKGFKKYDLGGVNAAQPGILTFKKSFGVDFYDLGSEWIHTPTMIGILLKIRFFLTKLRSNPVLT